MAWSEIRHADADSLAATLAGAMADACRSALAERRQAMLALAGGSTPLPVYARLAGEQLAWPRITTLPTDERWVAADDPACNRSAIARAMAGAPLQLRPLCPPRPEGPPDCTTARTALKGIGPFDGVVLGMGADGHFASLFPGSAALSVGLDPKTAEPALVVIPDPLPPEAPFARISLTLARLADARRIWLAITGDRKRAALLAAGRPGADPHQWPIAAMLNHPALQVEVHWSP